MWVYMSQMTNLYWRTLSKYGLNLLISGKLRQFKTIYSHSLHLIQLWDNLGD
jgi:hypothetical protein